MMTTRELVSGQTRREERPDPDWIRGRCPCCDEEVVSNVYYTTRDGQGFYAIVWECWGSLAEPPTCGFRRIL